jgi:ACS family glucarate transporter-like MFS transporter
VVLSLFCVRLSLYFLIAWLPAYLIEARHVGPGWTLGFAWAIPELAATGGGWAGRRSSNRLLRAGASPSTARKFPLVGGMLCGGITALAGVAPNPWAALALLTAGYAGLTFAAASAGRLATDLAPSPRHAASLEGVHRLMANVAVVGSPLLFGTLQGITPSFGPPLVLTSALAVVGAVTYGLLVGRADPLLRADRLDGGPRRGR